MKLKEVFARFGFPNTLVSDNGTTFTSAELNSFFQYYDIKHVTDPPYHPASNGAAANTVITFKLPRIKENIK